MRFLLIDDHKIIRDGLKQLLALNWPSALFDEGDNAEDIFIKLREHQYDVVICDLSMPGRTGLDAVAQVRASHPDLPVLILSMHPEEHYAVRAIKAGAWGYLNKTDGAEALFEAIKRVKLGRKYIPASLAEHLANNLSNGAAKLHEGLSNREMHVFKMLAEGKSISEIAGALCLGPSTVSTHRSRILSKMQLRTNADLTRYALQQNLL